MDLVDWQLAARVGRRLASDGPAVSSQEAADTVAELRELALVAEGHVAEVAQLRACGSENTAVVDRGRWIDANAAGMREVVRPLAESLAAQRGAAGLQELTAKAAAVQFGAALGWVSGKVLGQYEVFVPAGQRPRLLLVAPNIAAAERALDVPSRDFRLWVCLHEEAHRVQFESCEWLGDHFAAEVQTFLLAAETGGAEALRRLGVVAATVVRVLRGDPGASLVAAAQSPAQLRVFERLSALMSLLEGHAEWVMDAVGPEVLPSLPRIRSRFDQRRGNPAQGEGVMRRLLGLDEKLRQYTQGRGFVSGVIDRVGVAGFNRVWEQPSNLPSPSEISAPGDWVARVHGTG